MKYTYIFLILVLNYTGSVLWAQERNDDLLKNEAYLAFRKKSFDFYESENFKEEIRLSGIFRNKMGDCMLVYDAKNFNDWLKRNLGSTAFDSDEEGVVLFEKLTYLKKINDPFYKELAIVMNQLSKTIDYEVLLDFYSKDVKDKVFAKIADENKHKKAFYIGENIE